MIDSSTTDSEPQITGNERSTGEYTAVAALEQVLTGIPIRRSALAIPCSDCDTALGEGDPVSVDSYRPVETPWWYLSRCRCPDCASDSVESPMLGIMGVRVDARLALVSDVESQQHWLRRRYVLSRRHRIGPL